MSLLLVFPLIVTLSPTLSSPPPAHFSCLLHLNGKETVLGFAQLWVKPDGESRVELGVEPNEWVSSGLHGFHIHTNRVQGLDCLTAGGHYNPLEVTHGDPSNSRKPRHKGDMGNVLVNSDGSVSSTRVFHDVLNAADLEGRSLVFHAGEDDLGYGGDEGSTATGNAGGRLACCNLVRV
eukprot:sb/3471811/